MIDYLIALLDGFEDLLKDDLFRGSALDLCGAVVDDCLWDSKHVVLLGQFGIFHRLNHLAADVGIGQGHLMRHANRAGAVWSGGGYKHRECNALVNGLESFNGFLR